MPRPRRSSKRRRSSLSEAQVVELALGPVCRRCRDEDCHGRVCSAFGSPFLRRQAWFAHRAELLADWRVYELDCPYGPWVQVDGRWQPLSALGQAKVLARAGVLSDDELAALHADAREFGEPVV